MKALVKARSERGLWLQDVPEPQVGINDVLIKVRKTGICGTDLHIYKWDAWAQKTIPVPMVVGHEFVGEVVAVGSNVNDFHPGEIVSAEGHVVCGRCRNCLAGRRHLCKDTVGIGVNRTGAFAEYISVPMTNVWHHREGVDEEVASIFDPFGNAVHTALAFECMGEDVLITGAGPIGIMAAAVARHVGNQFEWVTHAPMAEKLGVAPATIESLRVGARPTGLPDDEALALDFANEVLVRNGASEPTYNAAVARFGEQGVVELTTLIGYFVMVNWVMNVAHTCARPAPGVAPLAPFPL